VNYERAEVQVASHAAATAGSPQKNGLMSSYTFPGAADNCLHGKVAQGYGIFNEASARRTGHLHHSDKTANRPSTSIESENLARRAGKASYRSRAREAQRATQSPWTTLPKIVTLQVEGHRPPLKKKVG
jgi:hypothetical protein